MLHTALRATQIPLALTFLDQAAKHVWGSKVAPGLIALCRSETHDGVPPCSYTPLRFCCS